MTTLVLIPGLAADATMWQAQLTGLARWNPVVTDVHMRHSRIESMAGALLEEHPGELVLCGASMGGMIAMEAARQDPERLRGLALLGTNARPETDEMRAVRESAIELFQQGRMAEVIEPNVALAFHPDQAADAALVRAYLELVYRAGAAQLVRQNRAVILRPDARLHLPRVRCPALVLHGDADLLTPPECNAEIARLIGHAQRVVIERCGHMLTMEKPAEVNAALAAWLEEIGVRGQ